MLTGFAVLMAATATIGATWNTTGAYSASQTGIVLGTIPESPDRVIALTAYGVGDDVALSDSVLGLQVLTRWAGRDPRPVYNLDAAIFALLQNSRHLILSTGVHVVLCARNSGPAPLGQDSNGRWSLSSNYNSKLHRPSTHRI